MAHIAGILMVAYAIAKYMQIGLERKCETLRADNALLVKKIANQALIFNERVKKQMKLTEELYKSMKGRKNDRC